MAKTSQVVIVRDAKVLRAPGVVDEKILSAMVEAALLKITRSTTPQAAWSSLFSPRDRVGIKVNALGGRLLSPSPAWVPLLTRGLKMTGMEEEKVLLWDRSNRELKEAGYPLNREGPGIRCYGTDAQGVSYALEPVEKGSISGLLSRILTALTDCQINLCVLKDHNLAGLSGALKNFYGGIHNPNKYHDNHCDPYIADLNALHQIRDKSRLVLCDALRVQYHGGPAFKSQWVQDYQAILVSLDPVALDFIGWRILDQIRRSHGLPTLEQEGRAPLYILTAGDPTHHLGRSRDSDIEVVELTV